MFLAAGSRHAPLLLAALPTSLQEARVSKGVFAERTACDDVCTCDGELDASELKLDLTFILCHNLALVSGISEK